MILDEIRKTEDKLGTSSITHFALKQCLVHLESLYCIAESLSPGFSSKSPLKRAWTAIDTVRQSEKISQFKTKLGEAKLTLILAQQGSAALVLKIILLPPLTLVQVYDPIQLFYTARDS